MKILNVLLVLAVLALGAAPLQAGAVRLAAKGTYKVAKVAGKGTYKAAKAGYKAKFGAETVYNGGKVASKGTYKVAKVAGKVVW